MKNIRTHEQFDAAAKNLIGLKLAGVTYFEIEYETKERCFIQQPHSSHVLDYGIEFRMAKGNRL